MKIGYFTTTFPYKDRFNDSDFFEKYTYGGAQVVAYYLANSMAQRRHEIKVFTTSVNSKDVIEEYDNIKIYRYGSKLKIEKRNIPYRLFQEPQNYPIDIIHAHSSIPIAVFAAIRCANRMKVPFIFTYHGDSQEDFGSFFHRTIISFYNKNFLGRVLSRADVIISPSKYYIDESRFLGKYRDKIVVIPNGVNLEEFDIPYSREECKSKLGLKGKNVVLFVGMLCPLKGPHILLKAIPKIVKEHKDTIFVFAGSGDVDEYKKLSEEIDVEKYVRFTGYISEEKPIYYRAADVFVLPSLAESFGIVNLEAMACGVPIVATIVGGVPDVVKNGENGLLVPPKDPNALTDALIYLLENEAVREKMGKNARKKVEDYSWEMIAERVEKIYKELIDEKG